MTCTEWRTQHGDPTAVDTEILRTVVGSGVHGIALEGTDDHDEMGVYIQPPEAVLGLSRVDGHYVARTQPEGARSWPGDTDLVLYSLRKYMALVTTGNPTALLPLFAPESDVLVCTDAGARLRAFGPSLLSQQAGWRFLGYLESQRQRLTGQSNRHTPNRPELVAAHGFDTKYAAHALRLAYQGLEVVMSARLTLPLPEGWRQQVLAVKRGEVGKAMVLGMIDSTAAEVRRLLEHGKTPLPEYPDLAAVNAWLTREHLAAWGLADRS